MYPLSSIKERKKNRVTITGRKLKTEPTPEKIPSGDGFEPEILEKLQKHEKLISPEGEHIGIYNVCQRLSILYSDCADIAFSNKPEGGARIDLYLPIRTMWWSEKDPEVQTDEK